MIQSIHLDWADFPMRLAFSVFSTGQWVPCTVNETHKLSNSANFSLKLDPTVLFTHLKIILLQCFQFSAISDIQTDPKNNHR